VELRQLEIDGTPIRYRCAGEGPPVVLVHGLSGSWRWWSPVWEKLAERRRVYLPDLPRLRRHLGPAELAALLGSWLEAAELESADLVGHSLGGLVAAELAAYEPDRVHRPAFPAGVDWSGVASRWSRRSTTCGAGCRRSSGTPYAQDLSASCAESSSSQTGT
jgi:pimeloyl-ACP methyl ester carboxylesterase